MLCLRKLCFSRTQHKYVSTWVFRKGSDKFRLVFSMDIKCWLTLLSCQDHRENRELLLPVTVDLEEIRILGVEGKYLLF